MRDEESRLLQDRQASSLIQFAFARVVLVISFLSAIVLLFWHYRLLRQELRGREEAEKTATAGALLAIEAERKAHASEQSALASQEAARRLNARLLQLRDEERRRFSRELHDSIGQYLAAAKMILSTLASTHADDKRYPECMNLLDQSLTEVRTISHLLHPPGLDEAGFASAARWYAEGFARRSGLNLKASISDPPQRMPREIEIALFRVMQESLINIHRHSKGGSAELTFAATPERALLNIKDDGVGIPADVLRRFESLGTSGVGLAGMRERIRELGGEFKVESRGGTSVQVTLPLTAPRSIAADVSGAH
jgi:signal transduction histidine kinase